MKIQDEMANFHNKKSFEKNINFSKSFTVDQEKDILREINKRIYNHENVTVRDIAQIALKTYYSPLGLSIRALINSKIKKGEKVTINNSELNSLLSLAYSEPQLLIENYGIKDFQASRTWIYSFMIRNGLVFRKAHYERRGKINEDQIEIFLSELAAAIDEFGEQRVINIDETFLLNENLRKETIAVKGQKTVKIDKEKLNQKEGTTFIGAIALDPNKRIPLTLISKGKTEVCQRKYGNKGKDLILHSKSGWSTSNLMKRYFRWLSEKMNKQPFALVLDIYKSHISEAVKKYAKKLKIKLIFVPACGTDTFQPLDHRIFAVLKSKLEKIDKGNSPYKSRWQRLKSNADKIWDYEISNKLIEAAWDIPGFDDIYEKKKKPSIDDEEFVPNDHDSESNEKTKKEKKSDVNDEEECETNEEEEEDECEANEEEEEEMNEEEEEEISEEEEEEINDDEKEEYDMNEEEEHEIIKKSKHKSNDEKIDEDLYFQD